MSPEPGSSSARRPGWRTLLAVAALIAGSSLAMQSCNVASAREEGRKIFELRQPSADVSGEEVAVLTHAPNVPPPITRSHPTKVIVNLDVVEKTLRLADSVEYAAWTFGGSVPGSFIRVREGDLVELHLRNDGLSTMLTSSPKSEPIRRL